MTTASAHTPRLYQPTLRYLLKGHPSHWRIISRPCYFSRRPRLRVNSFHTTNLLCLDDHYATLQLQPGAPAADIKKSFFRLSKAHHPDHNPDNREKASEKFMAVSEAYHVLGNDKKREQYNRELQQQRGTSASYAPPSGASGFSPGGRKASGLSRRRGAFRGPPPSFYRSGGWGDADEKRRTNQGADPREAEAKRKADRQYASTSGPFAGKTGAWPFATDPNDVGHFDREGHFRTQSSIDEQLQKGRQKRRSVLMDAREDMIAEEGAANSFGKFLQICGLLAVGIGLPVIILRY